MVSSKGLISECSAHTKCDWLLFGWNLPAGTWLGLRLLGSWGGLGGMVVQDWL